ncbi:toll-like receptor 2 [Mercenaria mercenaria]|uniref:toll-like receptor 2 n=1 Tax=Mercenaria mercenaria TaxID=6596 RepID=UPI00234EFC18|nr:toll-like receptor 2 [Mercenaria mercenaria]
MCFKYKISMDVNVIVIKCQILVFIILSQEPYVKAIRDNHVCHVSGTCVNWSNRNLSYIPKLPENTECLIFENNMLPNVTQGTFSNVSKPEKMLQLYLWRNGITFLSEDAFAGFAHLEYLELSGNKVQNDDIKLLLGSTCSNKHLKTLKLNSMMNLLIQEDTFSLMNETQLTAIHLMGNNIRNFSKSILQRMLNIRTLVLDMNLIQDLEFPEMVNLYELRMKGNRLYRVPNFCSTHTDSLSLVPNLGRLKLDYNKISSITNNTFQCLRNLTHFGIEGNLLSLIPNGVLSRTPNIILFNANQNTGHKALIEPRAFISQTLQTLEIGFDGAAQSIFISVSETFKHLPNLTTLEIDYIDMFNLSDTSLSKLLSPLTNLRYFKCYKCRIKHDPLIFLENKHYLTKINLKVNEIKTISGDTFRNNPSLKQLYLSENKIGHMKQSKEFLNSLEVVDLSVNPFVCDCELQWFISWFQSNHHTRISNPNRYTCSSPSKLAGKRVANVKFSYRQCHPFSTVEWFGMIGGPVIIVIVITSVVIYRNRWNIKHYIYLMRKRRNYIQVEGDIYAYDAFVAYNQDDSLWIREHLIPALEEGHNLKLCIHERDFQIGAFINDNTVNCIGESKKIILVMSNAFATSGWCMFELKVALLKHIEDGTKVIVVLLEKIQNRNMSKSLKVLIETTTYIEWTEDHAGQDLFWNKLKDAVGI